MPKVEIKFLTLSDSERRYQNYDDFIKDGLESDGHSPAVVRSLSFSFRKAVNLRDGVADGEPFYRVEATAGTEGAKTLLLMTGMTLTGVDFKYASTPVVGGNGAELSVDFRGDLRQQLVSLEDVIRATGRVYQEEIATAPAPGVQ